MDVAEHVATQFRAVVPDTFTGGWPSGVPNCVAIRLWDGSNAQYFGGSSVNEPLVLVLVRHELYATGVQWCNAFRDMFDGYSDVNILQMFMVGNVMHLGKNADNLHEFQMIFKTMTRE